MWKYTKVCANPRRGNKRYHTVEIHMRSCISTCGNSSGKVNFRMSVYKRICEFPRGKTCGNTRFFADFRMRKYTRICEFPRAEIHAERCITACGNTLNQVQKNSSGFCLKVNVVQSPQSQMSKTALAALHQEWDKKLIFSFLSHKESMAKKSEILLAIGVAFLFLPFLAFLPLLC